MSESGNRWGGAEATPRLDVLVHELRSPVAALIALAAATPAVPAPERRYWFVLLLAVQSDPAIAG